MRCGTRRDVRKLDRLEKYNEYLAGLDMLEQAGRMEQQYRRGVRDCIAKRRDRLEDDAAAGKLDAEAVQDVRNWAERATRYIYDYGTDLRSCVDQRRLVLLWEEVARAYGEDVVNLCGEIADLVRMVKCIQAICGSYSDPAYVGPDTMTKCLIDPVRTLRTMLGLGGNDMTEEDLQ